MTSGPPMSPESTTPHAGHPRAQVRSSPGADRMGAMTDRTVTRLNLRPILLFVAIAFGGAWLVALPMWLSGEGLAHPFASLLLIVMMFTPAIAALISARVFRSGESFARETTLRPSRPFRQWWGYGLLAWFGPLLVTLLAIGIAVAIGGLTLDLVNFSGFADTLDAATGGEALPVPIQVLVAVQLVSVLFLPIINVLPALGEELGWRGFLQARLLPLGQWPTVLITGVLWGLWHAPVVLLGYNYPGYAPVLALLMMVVFTTLTSVLLGWLTLSGGTVWLAAIAHGFINGVGGLSLLVAASGPVDPFTSGLLGLPGWIAMALLIVLLVVLKRFPVRQKQAA
ncbi:CPBP family intramembrane metalloprotease domain-containing protein [Salinibacterium hongtaonis]|nr:CPBP family intramembrane metalloprotease domain-containing protein [Salinibacterium hongtaonis]